MIPTSQVIIRINSVISCKVFRIALSKDYLLLWLIYLAAPSALYIVGAEANTGRVTEVLSRENRTERAITTYFKRPIF